MKSPGTNQHASTAAPRDDKQDALQGIGASPDTESDDIQNVMQELGESGGGSVRVDRLREGRPREFVDEFDVSSFSLKLLRDVAGGGDYILTVKDSSKRYKKQGRVTIAASAKPIATPQATSEPSALDKLAALIMKQHEEMREERRMLLDAVNRQPQQSTDLIQLVTALKTLNEISAPPKQVHAAPAEPVDRVGELRGMLDLARDLAGMPQKEGDQLDGIGLIGKALDKLGPLVERAMAQTAPPPRPAAPANVVPIKPSGAAPVSQPTQQPQTQSPPQSAEQKAIKSYVSMLLDSAVQGEDPFVWVGLMISRVPPEVVTKFVANPVELLAPIDARAGQCKEWLTELAQAIREELAGESDEAQPANPATA